MCFGQIPRSSRFPPHGVSPKLTFLEAKQVDKNRPQASPRGFTGFEKLTSFTLNPLGTWTRLWWINIFDVSGRFCHVDRVFPKHVVFEAGKSQVNQCRASPVGFPSIQKLGGFKLNPLGNITRPCWITMFHVSRYFCHVDEMSPRQNVQDALSFHRFQHSRSLRRKTCCTFSTGPSPRRYWLTVRRGPEVICVMPTWCFQSTYFEKLKIIDAGRAPLASQAPRSSQA